MAKPWHPYEQNFINHPKFLVLSAGAICLWIEGKNYCDMHLTDGMIPRDAMRTFRFNTRGRVEELSQQIDGYSGALWEVILIDGRDSQIGFRMHDYLNHNPCRDSVLMRIEKADGDRDRKKANQKAYRERMRDQTVIDNVTDNALVTKASSLPDKQKQLQKQLQKEQELRTHTVRARDVPLMGNEHRAHAECGRICVPAFLHRQFKDALGGNEQDADATLRAWYGRVLDALTDDEAVASDAPKFWRPLFDAEFVKTVKAERDYEAEKRAEVARLDELLKIGRSA